MAQQMTKEPEGVTVLQLIFRPLIGMLLAFAMFILAHGGMLVLSQGAAEETSGQLNPYVISFLGIISGLVSESATRRITLAAETFFQDGRQNSGKAQALQVEVEALEKRVTTLSTEQKQLQDEQAEIGRSLAASDLAPSVKEFFDARLNTIKARLASIEKDGKGELPEARVAADAKRKEFQEQLAAATKST